MSVKGRGFRGAVFTGISVMVFLCDAIDATLVYGDNCPAKFRDYPRKLSACLEPSPRASQMGVSDKMKAYIVKLHNDFRGNVEPKATNMRKMYWDDEIAMIAQKWASNCIVNHDGYKKRRVPGRYDSLGQNLAYNTRSWDSSIRAFYNEVKWFKYGVGLTNPSGQIGHYTQLVWATSVLIGCGYAKCNSVSNMFVCNYGPGGNYAGRLKTPYAITGERICDPKYQQGGLCDCGPMVCKGAPLMKDCTCKCTTGTTCFDEAVIYSTNTTESPDTTVNTTSTIRPTLSGTINGTSPGSTNTTQRSGAQALLLPQGQHKWPVIYASIGSLILLANL